MMPGKAPMHMQSVTSSRNKKSKVKLQDDRNCQENINRQPTKSQWNDERNCQSRCFKTPRRQVCDNKKCPSTVKKVSSDKNCQENQFIQPVKPDHRRLCKDQTFQSTRCYKKYSDPKKRQKMQYKVEANQSVTKKMQSWIQPVKSWVPEVRSHKYTPHLKIKQI